MARISAFGTQGNGFIRGMNNLLRFAGGSSSKEVAFLSHLATSDVFYWKDDFDQKAVNTTNTWTLTNV